MNRGKNNKIIGFDFNLCCETRVVQDGQVITHRKNILLQSQEKSKKVQKTSLKKRSAHSNLSRIPNQKPQNQPSKKNPIQIPAIHNLRTYTPTRPHYHPSTHLQNPLPLNYPPPITPLKYNQQLKQGILFFRKNKLINFTYNNLQQPHHPDHHQQISIHQQPTNNINNNCNQTFITQNKISQNYGNISHYSQINQKLRSDPYKSTQGTIMQTQRVQTVDDSPTFSHDFKIDYLSPMKLSNKIKGNTLGSSLGQRKKTVLSFNGDSQSQFSIAMFDLQPFPISKYSNFIHSGIIKGQSHQ